MVNAVCREARALWMAGREASDPDRPQAAKAHRAALLRLGGHVVGCPHCREALGIGPEWDQIIRGPA
jgi:hypothetical protein